MQSKARKFASALLAVAGLTAPVWGQVSPVSVTTYHNDNARTGQNTSETFLTSGDVNFNTFGKLVSGNVGLDSWSAAQPLYVAGVTVNGNTYNVVYVATLNNSVYAFDADSGKLLWMENYGTPTAFNSLCTDTGFLNSPSKGAGIVSTPAIDSVAGIMYFVTKVGNGTQSNPYALMLHAVDITTGLDESGSPVTIQPLTGPTFYPQYQMSRAGVLLSNGMVYVALSSTGCKGLKGFPSQNNHGYLLAYSTTLPLSSSYSAMFITTPDTNDGNNGGVWQSGGGIAEDSSGRIYVETADAIFDYPNGKDFGDSVIQLDNQLNVLDYFTPYNQSTLNKSDLDLGSVGPVVLPDSLGSNPMLVASGKTEEIFVLNRNSLGEYCSNCSSNINILQDVQRPSYLSGCVKPPTGVTTCRYGAISYWNNELYLPGWQAPLLSYQIGAGTPPMSTSPAASASIYQYVYPISISANNSSNGIAWAITATSTSATLRAFDAMTLNMLYSSDMATGGRDTLTPVAHFATPTVANGKVFVATQKDLSIYGLFNQLNPYAGNGQSGQVGTAITISAQAINPYTGQAISGVPVSFSDNAPSHGTFSPNPATTVNGVATTTYTLPTSAGTFVVTGASAGYANASFTETALPGPAASVNILSGSSQSAVVGTTLPNPLVSLVKDAYGNKVSGAAVTYSDGGLGGVFQPSATVTSSSNGQASVTYTLPLVARNGFPITASSGSATPATFRETSLASTPASIAITAGNKQTGTAGTQLAKALSVQVKDQYGNRVPNVTVTFSDNSAGGVFTSPSATTNSQGIASTMYTLPSSPGVWTITASINGMSVNFTETGN